MHLLGESVSWKPIKCMCNLPIQFFFLKKIIIFNTKTLNQHCFEKQTSTTIFAQKLNLIQKVTNSNQALKSILHFDLNDSIQFNQNKYNLYARIEFFFQAKFIALKRERAREREELTASRGAQAYPLGYQACWRVSETWTRRCWSERSRKQRLGLSLACHWLGLASKTRAAQPRDPESSLYLSVSWEFLLETLTLTLIFFKIYIYFLEKIKRENRWGEEGECLVTGIWKILV